MRFDALILMMNLCLAAPIWADQGEGYLSDAFGLVPLAWIAEERAEWSGVQAMEKNQKFQNVMRYSDGADSCAVFIGPKSLVAGRDEGHTVTIALDRHGNLVADGLPVTFRVGGERQEGASTRNGIGDLIFAPATEAGTFAAGAEVDSCQSPRALYGVTADLASVPLMVIPEDTGAPEQVMGLTTAPLVDRYGNPVEDGTALTVMMDHGVGNYSQFTARSIGAVGRGDLLTRDMPERAVVSATLATTVSKVTEVEIARVRLSQAPELRLWVREDLRELRLRVGPLTTDAGHLLYEGAEVVATVRAPDGAVAHVSGWAQDGYVWTDVPLAGNAAEGQGGYEIRVHTAYGDSVQMIHPGPAPRDSRQETVQ